MTLVPPFPWYGGKRKCVELVWPALGADVSSYVEPFFGGGAMLLGRPGGAGKYETVNDISGAITNFFRSVRADPAEVARYADEPVNEQNLHARHVWLVERLPVLTKKLEEDPNLFDPKVAGWWVWGQSLWIGDGFCREGSAPVRQLPSLAGRRGIHRKIPDLHGRRGLQAADNVLRVMEELSARLRHVRVVCGDFERVLSTAVLGTNATGRAQGIAPAGVFLDPPYPGHEDIFGSSEGVAKRAFEWAIANGDHQDLRIVFAGYEGDFEFPPSWRTVPWTAHGGYSLQGDGSNQNKKRERLYFSPHCRKTTQPTLMEVMR